MTLQFRRFRSVDDDTFLLDRLDDRDDDADLRDDVDLRDALYFEELSLSAFAVLSPHVADSIILKNCSKVSEPFRQLCFPCSQPAAATWAARTHPSLLVTRRIRPAEVSQHDEIFGPDVQLSSSVNVDT